jgi:hypothetical protein
MRILRAATAKKFFGVFGLLILCCGCSQPTLMTVTPTGIVSIIVSPLSVSVPLGVAHQFTAIGTFADGSTQDRDATRGRLCRPALDTRGQQAYGFRTEIKVEIGNSSSLS